MKRHWTEAQVNLAKEHETILNAFYVDIKNSLPEEPANFVIKSAYKKLIFKSDIENSIRLENNVCDKSKTNSVKNILQKLKRITILWCSSRIKFLNLRRNV
jgi:hypothetical protein